MRPLGNHQFFLVARRLLSYFSYYYFSYFYFNRSTQVKPTQPWGKHANSTQTDNQTYIKGWHRWTKASTMFSTSLCNKRDSESQCWWKPPVPPAFGELLLSTARVLLLYASFQCSFYWWSKWKHQFICSVSWLEQEFCASFLHPQANAHGAPTPSLLQLWWEPGWSSEQRGKSALALSLC